ncbi:TPA: DMT family transporter [Burkholderia multivorans]|uniref:DMT family transporter n=1 Tax=Burkholderia multivorans TaxID=87883 RepID=UPI00158F4FCF|nr:DMT family transporter [Burkholderia multivorans]MBU9316906.1 DMT family transporter [Burkholderia multivorans]MBU9666824.1 DMT family transporter [Burkholderia multivorans]MDN7940144.1 DMT family transporter [Burkholderia multivorans]HEF4742341.1 DMT family transporter [Burkholderia multivorans]HEF4755050.1 DMT family transporter [Burkholderia multivorans]
MNALQLVTLAAIWGASFLFMRMGAPEFGVIPLIALRVAIAAVLLSPVLRDASARREFRTHAVPLFVVGVANSALPFCLLTYAALFVTAGTDSILNATTPLWTALVAYVWLRTPLTKPQTLGLAVGFAGVVVLAGSAVGAGAAGTPGAIAAAMLATLSYGFAAHYSKRKLANVRPFVSAFGSQLFAAVVLTPLAAPLWPRGDVHASAWIAVVLLGAVCTAIAYLLYFRLIRNAGAQYAASVTFLIPVFGVVWGAVFLHETITAQTLAGCAIILLGTALATGKLNGFATAAARASRR